MSRTASWHWIVPVVLAGGAALWARDGHPQRAARARVAGVAPVGPAHRATLVTQLAAFQDALQRGDEAFLSGHTRTPIQLSWVEYDMEVVVRRASLRSAAEVLRRKDLLLLPPAFLRALRESPAAVRQGVERCGSDAAQADYESGPPALRVEGARAWVSYLAQPCEAETHVVTLEFRAGGDEWGLAQRQVRVGAR